MHVHKLCVCVNSVQFVLANRILKIFYTVRCSRRRLMQSREKHDLFCREYFTILACLIIMFFFFFTDQYFKTDLHYNQVVIPCQSLYLSSTISPPSENTFADELSYNSKLMLLSCIRVCAVFDYILLFTAMQFTKWFEGDFCVGVFHLWI